LNRNSRYLWRRSPRRTSAGTTVRSVCWSSDPGSDTEMGPGQGSATRGSFSLMLRRRVAWENKLKRVQLKCILFVLVRFLNCNYKLDIKIYFIIFIICVTLAESWYILAKTLCIYRDFQPQIGQVWRKISEESRTFNDAWAD